MKSTATKAVQRLSGIPMLFDRDGFALDPREWTPEIANQLAEFEGVGPLTDQHWRIINYVRDRYLGSGALPLMRLICRATNLDRLAVQRLFGRCKVLWRIAGLPNPGEEAKAHIFS